MQAKQERYQHYWSLRNYLHLAGLLLVAALGLFGFYQQVKQSPGSIRADIEMLPSRSISTDKIQQTTSIKSRVYLPVQFKGSRVLKNLVTEISIHLPFPLSNANESWCTWGWCALSPRLYHEPLSDGQILVGWTDSSGSGHVITVDSLGNVKQTVNFTDHSVAGLVAHPDGRYAVLLWNASTNTMWLSKREANGSEIWKTTVNGRLTHYDSGVGDSRLTYGNGLYAAYFAVYGVTGWVEGHNADQLSYVDDNGSIQPGGWEWGCSHSLAELVAYHPVLKRFLPVCSSDCFSSKGLLINSAQVLYPCDGDCAGRVSAQFGQVAMSSTSWKVAFSALNKPCCSGQGIGLATIDSTLNSSFIWLTNTNGNDERDPVLARIGANLGTDRYLTGWMTTNNDSYWLAVIDGNGRFLTGPEEVTSQGISWGNRDDSMRTRPDGRISWVRGEPFSSTLKWFIFNGDTYLARE